MLVIDEKKWREFSDREKVDYLIEMLKSYHHRGLKFYNPYRPRDWNSAAATLRWITSDITGYFKIIGVDHTPLPKPLYGVPCENCGRIGVVIFLGKKRCVNCEWEEDDVQD